MKLYFFPLGRKGEENPILATTAHIQQWYVESEGVKQNWGVCVCLILKNAIFLVANS